MFVLILFTVAPFGAADILSCAQSATESTIACRSGSSKAKREADSISASYNQKVAGKSVKETADLLAEATNRIQTVYQNAEQLCATQVASCRRECADSESQELGAACAQENGKYQRKMGDGRQSNADGNQGAKKSSGQASASGTKQDKSEAEKGKAAVGADGKVEAERGRIQANTDAATGGSARAENAGGGGDAGTNGAGKSFDPTSTPASSALEEDEAKVLARAVGQFCADAKNGGCPSCQGAKGVTQANLKSSCNQACMADPAFGPELGGLCRQMVAQELSGGSAGGAANGAGGGGSESGGDAHADRSSSKERALSRMKSTTREPNSLASNVSPALGPALFVIHSRVITDRCRRWGLLTCPEHPYR